jgi:amino acid transporter
MSLIMAATGGLVALAGTMAYCEWGCFRSISGGEREYLLIGFPRTKGLFSFIFTQVSIFLIRPGSCATEAIFFAQNIAFAIWGPDTEPDVTSNYKWSVKGIAALGITFLTIAHVIHPRLGIAIQDILSLVKIFLLGLILAVAFCCVVGWNHTLISENFSHSFDGTTTNVPDYASALFVIMYTLDGWNNLNYSLDELINPERNLPVAALLGVTFTIVLFMASLISHFLIIPKELLATSSTIITNYYFEKTLGSVIGLRIIPVFVGLSSLGTSMCIAFGSSRLTFSAARDGSLFDFFGATTTDHSPYIAFFLNMLLSLIFISIPSDSIYELLITITNYPLWIFYGLTVLGLVLNRKSFFKRPFKSWLLMDLLFICTSVFLMIVPFLKHDDSSESDYWIAPLVGLILVFCTGLIHVCYTLGSNRLSIRYSTTA